MKKLRVAIIGQGRSGRDIHGNFFRSEANDFVEVAFVADELEDRRELAEKEYGCPAFSDYKEFFAHKDEIDLVVNASYSQYHYPITKDSLEHGFNVLVEKPFSATKAQCDELIAIAEKNNVVVTAFHQTLYNPMHKKIKEIIASGVLGEIYQINLKYSGFARRWDWQTLQVKIAGGIYNSGPHPIGQALDFLDWDEKTEIKFAYLKRALTFGDADDHAKIILQAPDKPVIDIDVTSIDCFPEYTFKVFGRYGTLSAGASDYKMKYIDFSKELPKQSLTIEPIRKPDGTPAYCREALPFVEVNEHVEGNSFDSAVEEFYKMMQAHIIGGKELEITPQKAEMVINIIDKCHQMNPLSVEFKEDGTRV